MGPALWRLPTQLASLQKVQRYCMTCCLHCFTHWLLLLGACSFAPCLQEYAEKALLKNPGDIAAFVELHIEQGPALEAEGKDIGIVEAIMAPSLVRIKFTGKGGHGGGMPMSYRCSCRQPYACISRYYWTPTGLLRYPVTPFL